MIVGEIFISYRTALSDQEYILFYLPRFSIYIPAYLVEESPCSRVHEMYLQAEVMGRLDYVACTIDNTGAHLISANQSLPG